MTDYTGWAPYVQPTQPGYLAQNNANLNYVNNASQASYNPNTLYGPGGFGAMTDAYSAAGAAYGRATGGFTPTTPMGSVFDTGTTPYESYGQPQTYSNPDAGSSQAQAYYQAHLAKYGFAPELTNSTYNALLGGGATGGSAGSGGYNSFGGGAYGAMAGGGFGGMVGAPSGNYSDPNAGSSQAQAYYQAHLAKYGFAPELTNATYNAMLGGGGPFQSATGNVGQSSGMAPGYGGLNNPASSPPASFNERFGSPVDLRTGQQFVTPNF